MNDQITKIETKITNQVKEELMKEVSELLTDIANTFEERLLRLHSLGADENYSTPTKKALSALNQFTTRYDSRCHSAWSSEIHIDLVIKNRVNARIDDLIASTQDVVTVRGVIVEN